MMEDARAWDPGSIFAERGATGGIRVEGRHLEPFIYEGDFAAMRPQAHASHGDIVLARLSDGVLVLAMYDDHTDPPSLTTAAPDTYPPPTGPFQIVAIAVGMWGNRGPAR